MPMRATTVRFSDSLWTLIEREASRDGVSAAQYVRDATVLRTAYEMGRRGDGDFDEAIERASGRTEVGLAQPLDGSERRRALLDAAAAVEDQGRLVALHATGLLDSDISPSFDRLARLASSVLNAPVALVSLVDSDRQFFKSCLGLPEPWASQRESPLTHSFCQHAVASREPLLVDDSREHAVLRDNLAIRDMGVIAYAGIPLTTPDDDVLGSFCAIDNKPRTWTKSDLDTLNDFAQSAMAYIDLGAHAPATPQA